MEAVVYRVLGMVALLVSTTLYAQTEVPPLERVMSVELSGASSQKALKVLEEKGGFYFAYRTDLVTDDNHLNRSYHLKTTREILDDIFQSEVSYKQKGNYIILRDAPKLKDQEVRIEGYVYNVVTNEKVGFASVYDTMTLVSSVSDAFGHYSIQMTKRQALSLEVKKSGYYDTTIVWDGTGSTVLNIPVRPIAITAQADTTEEAPRFKFLKLSDEQKANIINFKEKLKGKVQFSVVPGVGTNGDLAPVTDVDYSFNLLGGFNQSVKKAEVGGFFNIDYDTVQYFQAAGFFNAVGGYQRGVQLAGFTNLNNDSFKGVQAAGFYSLVRKDMHGFQAGGFASSTHGALTGMQAAGFGNFADSTTQAVQAAGFGNVGRKEFHGVQIGGFGNYAGRNSSGVQLAGFANVAGNHYRGTQLAGFINVARDIQGYQVGFINYNDTIDGVPFGFLSFSRKGLHQLELSGNEFSHANIAFKTGTNQFYNTFLIGSRIEPNPYWSFGYGIGSSVRTSPKSRIFFDLQASSLQQEDKMLDASILNRFIVTYQYNFTKKFAIAAGPSFNAFWVRSATSLQGINAREMVPYSFYDEVHGTSSLQMWVGGQLALRFF